MDNKLSNFFRKRRRNKMINRVLKSGIIAPGSEANTVSQVAEILLHYIDTGKFDPKKALPNGYRWENPT